MLVSAPKLKLGAISYANLYPYNVGLYFPIAVYVLSIALQKSSSFSYGSPENIA